MPALGWRPKDFWAASLVEITQAIEGYSLMHGGDGGKSGFTDADREEVERLKERYSGSDNRTPRDAHRGTEQGR